MTAAGGALLTDLYQLTMLQAYFREGLKDSATFELFVRKLPPGRNFLVLAGLEQLVEYLEAFRFTDEERAWLRACGYFSADFVDYLAGLRFTGDVWAMPEGTAFFQDEPVIRVTAPLPEAQAIETRLINLMQFQTMIVSKAVRSVLAAPGKLLVDFGLRRAHGAEAGLLAARAFAIAGFAGTSNVLAGMRFGMPLYGTMAHSYIMAHDDEMEAFERFALTQPDNAVLLIDTYDTLRAARKVVALATRLAERDVRVKAVRLDSGDLLSLSREVRRVLDAGGLTDCRIFASGDLDEYELKRLIDSGAPIDGFGVGTRAITSEDAPYLNCAYKLEEYAGRPRLKRSAAKATWPGCKQVYRSYDLAGRMQQDVVTLATEPRTGEPLLQPLMKGGRRVQHPESLTDVAARLKRQIASLPAALRELSPAEPYPVIIADALKYLSAKLSDPPH
jgi:nicotinate phosphoribosyltransferase